jgi:cytoskeleton protein RodZ
MNFSELRHARERLGLSLRDISDRTKIRASILGSIERNEIDRLPPPIFTRAFVRAYAREVGLDPNAFVDLPTRSQPVAAASSDLRNVNAIVERRVEGYDLSERDSSSVITTVLIVAAAGLLLFLTDPWKASSPAGEERTSTTADATAATRGTAAVAAVATSGAERPNALRPASPPNMRMELQPQGPCWIEATADGSRVIYRLLNAGDRYALEGYEDLVLKVGDPGALFFTIDGSKGRQLGPAGQPTTVHITRENSRQFIVAS